MRSFHWVVWVSLLLVLLLNVSWRVSARFIYSPTFVVENNAVTRKPPFYWVISLNFPKNSISGFVKHPFAYVNLPISYVNLPIAFVNVLSAFLNLLSGLVNLLSGLVRILSGIVRILSGFFNLLTAYVMLLLAYVKLCFSLQFPAIF